MMMMMILVCLSLYVVISLLNKVTDEWRLER